MRCVLEECPKWSALCSLLDEIRLARADKVGDSKNTGRGEGNAGAGEGECTLVLVRDVGTLCTVRELLLHGSRKLLEATFMQVPTRASRLAALRSEPQCVTTCPLALSSCHSGWGADVVRMQLARR